MKTFTTTAHREYIVGDTDSRLFGSFVEHMGSVVYNGIYQPGHPNANEKGYRMDVLRLLQGLGLGVLRYPGGNYTSAYRWEDTVGKDRPAALNYAWREMEPNTFGLHEFFDWATNFNAPPMMTLNLATRGALEAADLLQYCNFPSGTRFSDMRRQNGAEKPFDVKLWCLGNEIDGDWQMGHMPPKEYGRLADVTAQLLRQLDPTLELACVGSSNTTLDNYPEWNRKVLMQCYDRVDYITLHKYLSKKDIDTHSYLCMPHQVDGMIETVVNVCDYVGACKRSKHRVNISFDEWNVGPVEPDGNIGEWETGPARDCMSFTFEDTLVFAGMFLSLLRHANRVKIACQSLIVNDIGLVLADEQGAYPNGSYAIFKRLSDHARGTVLLTRADGAMVETTAFGAQPALDTLVVRNDAYTCRAFVINRSEEDVLWTLDLGDLCGKAAQTAAQSIRVPLETRNSHEDPQAIAFTADTAPEWREGKATGVVRAYSITEWSFTEVAQ